MLAYMLIKYCSFIWSVEVVLVDPEMPQIIRVAHQDSVAGIVLMFWFMGSVFSRQTLS